MFAWLERHGLRGPTDRGYGLAHDDPRVCAPENCRYDACVEVPDHLPAEAFEGLTKQRLPSGAYARKRHIGPHGDLSTVMREMRLTWSSRHGLELCRKRPALEIYLDDPKFVRPERLRTDICLPIAFSSARTS